MGDANGKTSPEELMAAAHAACYAMAVNGTLGRKSASTDRTIVSATVTADKGDAGIKIVSSRLSVIAYHTKRTRDSSYAVAAKQAATRGPPANAYRGSQ